MVNDQLQVQCWGYYVRQNVQFVSPSNLATVSLGSSANTNGSPALALDVSSSHWSSCALLSSLQVPRCCRRRATLALHAASFFTPASPVFVVQVQCWGAYIGALGYGLGNTDVYVCHTLFLVSFQKQCAVSATRVFAGISRYFRPWRRFNPSLLGVQDPGLTAVKVSVGWIHACVLSTARQVGWQYKHTVRVLVLCFFTMDMCISCWPLRWVGGCPTVTGSLLGHRSAAGEVGLALPTLHMQTLRLFRWRLPLTLVFRQLYLVSPPLSFL